MAMSGIGKHKKSYQAENEIGIQYVQRRLQS